jgi:hypothetical protein
LPPRYQAKIAPKIVKRVVRFCASNPVRVTDDSVYRKRHKLVCKGDKTGQKQKRPSLRLLKSPMIRFTDNTRNDEKELITEWPTSGGGTTKVSSTTMTSAFMKDVRGHLEKEFGSK